MPLLFMLLNALYYVLYVVGYVYIFESSMKSINIVEFINRVYCIWAVL